MVQPKEKILVVGPAWVGDMVMAQSLFKTLHEKNPHPHIDVLAPRWSLPLLRRMPEVDQAMEIPIGHGQLSWNARLRLGKRLRSERYSQAIIIPRSWKSALTPFWAKIPIRTGYIGEFRHILLNDVRSLDTDVLGTTVERYTALGLSCQAAMPPRIKYPQLQMDPDHGRFLLRKFDMDTQQPIAGLMPGAEFGPAKQWPASHFAHLVKKLNDEGWQVCILGSPKDFSTGEEIRTISHGRAINLCGQTSLEDAVDLLAHTSVAVTNDSGLMHIAASVGSKVVAIFGSSSPDYTPPLTSQAVILKTEIQCRPCFQRQCHLDHYRCLKEIEPRHVLSAIHNLCR